VTDSIESVGALTSGFPWGDQFGETPRCPQAPSTAASLGPNERAHVGVVFVHGVGFQHSGDTFRESIAPFMRLLREAGFPGEDPLHDPTRVAAQELPGTDLPFVELDLPRSSGDSREHWVITEAWWAASFAPPSLGTMLGWLGVQGKAAIAARRIKVHGRRTDLTTPRWPSYRRSSFLTLPLEITLTVGVSLLLLIYAILRAFFTIIPIGKIREAVIGPIDRFVQEWAGDMRVLLQDETQAAMVRFRIARSIRALQAYGCESVVVIAHSGGAVASYMTLADDQYRSLPVKKLITYGSGLNAGWRLLEIDDRTHPDLARRVGGRVAYPLAEALEWHDFWATDDPVPAGPVNEAPPSACVPLRSADPPHMFGNRVNNRWSLFGDHGTYLTNDEEFLVAVASAIDDEVRPPEAARLFGRWPEEARATAIRRRLERVAGLSMWSRFVSACSLVAIFGAIVAGLIGYWLYVADGLTRPFGDVTDWLGRALLQLFGQDVQGLFEKGAAASSDSPRMPAEFMAVLGVFTLIGYLAWLVILASLVGTMAPNGVDWIRAWSGSGIKQLTAVAATGAGWLVIGFVAVLGVPGLLGVMLASNSVWDWGPFVSFRHAIENATSDLLGRALGSAFMNLVIAVLVLLFGSVLFLGAAWMVGRLRSQPAWAFVVNILIAILGLVFLAGLVIAIFSSGGFRSNLAGWLLILVVFIVINRIGQWRWGQWDDQERWELRSSILGGSLKRRLGRTVDAIVFGTLVATTVLATAGIILRPLWIDTANLLLLLAGIGLLLGLIAGTAQDEVNLHLGAGGEGPSVVSKALSGE
jgi:hypothetical protein